MKMKKVIDTFYPLLIKIDEKGKIQYFVDKDPTFMHIGEAVFKKAFKYINSKVKLESESIDSLIRKITVLLERFNFKKFGIDVSEASKKHLKTYLAYKIVGLGDIYPLLIDDNIREIYIDGPNKNIYIDHLKYGRLTTNISLDEHGLDRFIFLLKMYTNLILTSTNPSAKVDLFINNTRLRISVDSFPLTENGVTIIIRKLDNKPLSLHYLINKYNKVIFPTLILLLASKSNIIIIGEPGSGKTTLASFLINLLPRYWRIVAIEDTKEFPDLREHNFIRYKVEPFESRYKNITKEKEIIKLLHRSPDWIVLGEIQDKNDVLAMFHAFSAGLKGLATFHATSLEEFIDRIVNSFGVNFRRIGLIDAIIIMNKKIAPHLMIREIKDIILIYKRALIGSSDWDDLLGKEFVGVYEGIAFISVKNAIQMSEKEFNTGGYILKHLEIILKKFKEKFQTKAPSVDYLLGRYTEIEMLFNKFLEGKIGENYVVSRLRELVERIWLFRSSNTKVSP